MMQIGDGTAPEGFPSYIIYLIRSFMLKSAWLIVGLIWMLRSFVYLDDIKGILCVGIGVLCFILAKLIDISCQIEENTK